MALRGEPRPSRSGFKRCQGRGGRSERAWIAPVDLWADCPISVLGAGCGAHRPRWLRIFRMTAASSMRAITRMGPLQRGHSSGIDFVNLVNQARPGGAHARSLARIDLARCDFRRFGIRAPALSSAAVRVPAGVAHQVFETIWDERYSIRMDPQFRPLLEAASRPYAGAGRYAWHFARGKLRRKLRTDN